MKSLSQGKYFNDLRRNKFNDNLTEINEEHANLFDINLQNVTEGMSSNIRSKPKVKSDLKKKFQTLMSDYTSTLKMINDETNRRRSQYGSSLSLFNKVITSSDGTKSYVNGYGYVHPYTDSAWENNSSSCPQNTEPDRGLSVKLPTSRHMGNGQACGVAGKNIQNNSTKEYAWVDIKGIKHVYVDWSDKSSECQLRDLIILSDEEYKAIPNGVKMEQSDQCQNIDVDKSLFNKLVRLNSQLITTAKELTQEIDTLDTADEELKNSLQVERYELNRHLSNLSKDNDELYKLTQNYNTIKGQEEDSYLKYNSSSYQLILWSILALSIGGITMKQLSK